MALTVEEKAAAFDDIALALTNRWWDGTWSWQCLRPSGGEKRATRAEAVRDLIEYGKKRRNHVEKRRSILESHP